MWDRPGGGRFINRKSNKMNSRNKAGGRINSTKQKFSTNAQMDNTKIINFLRSVQTPQRSIAIAKACGYESAKDINPCLYMMESQHIVRKMNDTPPLWGLLPTDSDISGNVSSPRYKKDSAETYYGAPQQKPYYGGMHQQTHQEAMHQRTIVKSSGGVLRHQQKGKFGKRTERSNKNTGERVQSNFSCSSSSTSSFAGSNYSKGTTLIKTGSVSNKANVAVATSQPSSHVSLFKKTINDTTAPGAYRVQEQLEHSQEKRFETFETHRRHSPSYPSTRASELPEMLHESTQSDDLTSRIGCGDNTYLANKGTNCSPEPKGTIMVEASATEPFSGNHMDVSTLDDDSDDDDYDLNSRIFELVSIRDPNVGNELSIFNNSDKSSMQNYGDNDSSCDQEMATFKSDQDVKKEWEDYDSSGESDPEPPQMEQCLKLLKLLSELPLQSSMSPCLASELHLAPGDISRLLDACGREGWIDYSPLNHVRLTEFGNKYISELNQSRKSDERSMQQHSGLPPYPDQFLQNTSSSSKYEALLNEKHRSSTSHPDKCESHHDDSDRNRKNCAAQSSDFNESASIQLNPTQEIKKLMPWLSSSFQKAQKEQATFSSERTNAGDPSLPTPAGRWSLLPTPPATQMSVHATSSSFQHFMRDSKSSNSAAENQTFIDYLKPGKTTSSLQHGQFLSQQEYLQQKRPPLLSTPDTREPTNFPRFSPGKNALLVNPGQSLLQLQQQAAPTNLQISTESFAALNKNPISAFMEYGQCRHTAARIEVFSQSGPSHKPVFTIAAVLGSRVFPGITSSNKKDGKKDAAEQAIRILIAEGQYNMPASSSVMSIPESSMTQFDKVAALTHHKFNQLIAVIPESLVGRKVIAGLVMKMNDADTGTVVAIGSGNRCITGDKLSLRGLTLNDCHAEIITRRGFIRFLYHQLRSYDFKKDHPIFEKSKTGKLRIKASISFHLYISTAPCGDGALFSPRDVVSNNVTLTDSCSSHRPTFDTNVQGVLRTKMEGGEGTIPVDPEKLVQTWDGIVRGERLRTMSCSDKICRWNVVGLQGALLANLLDPVYLNSITLGFLFDAGHLSRAVCCRLNRGEPVLDRCLPFPYRLNHPVLGRVTACDATRETQKTKSYSINWMVEDEKPEIVDGCQGTCYTGDKNEPSQPSRLCKKYLFDSYTQTCQVLGQKDLLKAPTYFSAKRLNTHFHQAKEAMFNKFKDTNCGLWLDKPQEEKMFT